MLWIKILLISILEWFDLQLTGVIKPYQSDPYFWIILKFVNENRTLSRCCCCSYFYQFNFLFLYSIFETIYDIQMMRKNLYFSFSDSFSCSRTYSETFNPFISSVPTDKINNIDCSNSSNSMSSVFCLRKNPWRTKWPFSVKLWPFLSSNDLDWNLNSIFFLLKWKIEFEIFMNIWLCFGLLTKKWPFWSLNDLWWPLRWPQMTLTCSESEWASNFQSNGMHIMCI